MWDTSGQNLSASVLCECVCPACCRELTSFVFIFESANRIVVEKPNYGHATYFFDLEEPLPVADQVMPVPHAVQWSAKHSTADAISSKDFFWATA